MKKILILIAVVLLFVIACDVLEHDPYSNDAIEDTFAQLNDAFSQISGDDLSAVMNFYNDSYIYYGELKEEREEQFLAIIEFYDEDLNFSVSVDEYNSDKRVVWNLIVTSVETSEVLKNITFKEYVEMIDNNYAIVGNGKAAPPELDSTKPVVFMEYCTYEACGNCPPVGAKLHEMQMEFGGQFIYVEYCLDQAPTQLSIENFASYYSAFTQPYTVVQGSHSINGGLNDDLNLMDQLYDEIESGSTTALMEVIEWNEVDNKIIEGAVSVNLNGIPVTDLQLRYALINVESDFHYTIGGDELHNVVFAIGSRSIYTDGVYSFELDYNGTGYDELPEKTKIVCWLNTRPETFDFETNNVHTAAELKLYED